MLIYLSDGLFEKHSSSRNDEAKNEQWTCKTCGSVYEYGWSDFSIHVNRQKLELVELKTVSLGKPGVKPIPLVLGLSGHKFPPRTEMAPVSLEEMENYLLEK